MENNNVTLREKELVYPDTIWVVGGKSFDYEDFETWDVCFFLTKDEAEKYECFLTSLMDQFAGALEREVQKDPYDSSKDYLRSLDWWKNCDIKIRVETFMKAVDPDFTVLITCPEYSVREIKRGSLK